MRYLVLCVQPKIWHFNDRIIETVSIKCIHRQLCCPEDAQLVFIFITNANGSNKCRALYLINQWRTSCLHSMLLASLGEGEFLRSHKLKSTMIWRVIPRCCYISSWKLLNITCLIFRIDFYCKVAHCSQDYRPLEPIWGPLVQTGPFHFCVCCIHSWIILFSKRSQVQIAQRHSRHSRRSREWIAVRAVMHIYITRSTYPRNYNSTVEDKEQLHVVLCICLLWSSGTVSTVCARDTLQEASERSLVGRE